MMKQVLTGIGDLIEIVILLLALAIVLSLLLGAENLLFFGQVVQNIANLVKFLGDAGLAGLIALGVIIWLYNWIFSKR